APPVAHTRSVHTGGRGRPRIEIDTDVLATAYQLAGPTRLAQVFNVSARTIRRRALEQQIVEPGDPVFVTLTDEDGHVFRIHTSSTGSQSTLTDEELDGIISIGLIRYKMVTHAFIDGFSRFITGIRVSNNNRAETVFDLFQS
ncbi:hypothetical protein C8R48DRAFT_566298, partial [Suillus tomentosus]